MRFGRAVGLVTRLASNLAVAPLERLALPSAPAPSGGPVFIIGAPRSGTTLLYQCLTGAFEVAYLTNRHCRWYQAPVLVERLAPTPFGPQLDFESDLGVTSGLHAPSECGPYWYRFLPRQPHLLSADAVPAHKLDALRRSLDGLSTVSGRPVVVKNLVLSLRIPSLLHAFPAALFIVVHRDMTATAASILRARERLHGRLDRWFSVRPPGCDRLEDPVEQVVCQVRAIHAEIARVRQVAGEGQFIDVDYGALCETPNAVLDAIGSAAGARGISLRRRPSFHGPSGFARRREGEVAKPAWWDALQKVVARSKSQ